MPSVRFDSANHPQHPGECVALVHGYLANTLMLSLLGKRLRASGYLTNAWGYWNMQCSLLVHAERFGRELEALDADPRIETIHLVTHSMGCIIGRAALDRFRPRKLGRFVMLAPPNRGSFIATATARTFGRFLRPVAELSTAEDSLVNSLPMPEGVEIGVIAAQYDALVAEESTHLDGPHAHVTLPTWHTGLLFSRETADLVAAFLATGAFPAVTTTAGSANDVRS
jgi:triacylglycerol esterase/lipase EstA (alpha/beta hydrolase family)